MTNVTRKQITMRLSGRPSCWHFMRQFSWRSKVRDGKMILKALDIKSNGHVSLWFAWQQSLVTKLQIVVILIEIPSPKHYSHWNPFTKNWDSFSINITKIFLSISSSPTSSFSFFTRHHRKFPLGGATWLSPCTDNSKQYTIPRIRGWPS